MTNKHNQTDRIKHVQDDLVLHNLNTSCYQNLHNLQGQSQRVKYLAVSISSEKVMNQEEEKNLPKHLTLTIIPWLSIIESTYRPEPEQVVHKTAPLASHLGQWGLSPVFFLANDNPIGFSILSSGTDLS